MSVQQRFKAPDRRETTMQNQSELGRIIVWIPWWISKNRWRDIFHQFPLQAQAFKLPLQGRPSGLSPAEAAFGAADGGGKKRMEIPSVCGNPIGEPSHLIFSCNHCLLHRDKN